jgi:hypothetical protein
MFPDFMILIHFRPRPPQVLSEMDGGHVSLVRFVLGARPLAHVPCAHVCWLENSARGRAFLL